MKLDIASKLAETASKKAMANGSDLKGTMAEQMKELAAQKQKVMQLEEEKAKQDKELQESAEVKAMVSNLKHQALAYALSMARNQ